MSKDLLRSYIAELINENWAKRALAQHLRNVFRSAKQDIEQTLLRRFDPSADISSRTTSLRVQLRDWLSANGIGGEDASGIIKFAGDRYAELARRHDPATAVSLAMIEVESRFFGKKKK